jgi:uncharacterized protein (DUF2147 family)
MALKISTLPIRTLTAAVVLGALATPAAAADPKGTWATEGGRSHVAISDCGGALCGAIVWLKEPNDPETGKPKLDVHNADAGKRNRPLLGTRIVLNMKPNGKPGQWAGNVYNAQDGKTYSGSITLESASTLKLEGCALGGLICKTQTWTRTN